MPSDVEIQMKNAKEKSKSDSDASHIFHVRVTQFHVMSQLFQMFAQLGTGRRLGLLSVRRVELNSQPRLAMQEHIC
jgi:hypothetical protein